MSQPPKPNPSPAPPVAPPSEPTPLKPGLIAWDSRPGWGTFRTGLLLMIVGLVLGFLVLLGSVLTIFSAFNAVRAGNVGNPGDMLGVMLTFSVCSGLASLWILTGLFLAPSVPGESGASGWGFLTFLGLIGTLIISGVLTTDTIRRGGGQILGDGFPFGGAFRANADRPGNAAPIIQVQQGGKKLVVQGGQPMDANTVLSLGYALLGCIVLMKLAFTLTIFQVARFFSSRGLAISIALYLVLFSLTSALVALGSLGKLPVLQDDPVKLAGLLSLSSAVGGFVFALWMLINLMVVRGKITNGLLKPVPNPAA
jgi:hypothetical protein